MHSLLETSPTVARLITPEYTAKLYGLKYDFVEGNIVAPNGGYSNLHGPHSMECNMEHVYNDPKNYNWCNIKSIWNEIWAKNNPYAEIKMQKTPTDVIRLKMMHQHFEDCKWIISVRNPYAFVESIMRKATFMMDPIRQLDQVCYHVTRMMELQLENIEFLNGEAYVMTYEDFVARPAYHADKLVEWMPRLLSLNVKSQLMVKGKVITSIHDDSSEKIQNLIDCIPGIIERINGYFEPKRHVIEAWGYSMMK